MISEDLKRELILLVEEKIKKVNDNKNNIDQNKVNTDNEKESKEELKNVPKIKGYNYGVPGVF